MTTLAVYLAILANGAVWGANLYTSVVDAPVWGARIPESLEVARRYFGARNPGTFFRVASPLAALLGLIVVGMTWPAGGTVRELAVAALALGVLADLFTFRYFYPRNDVMFAQAPDAVAMTRAWREWSRMNHVRSAMVLAALVCQLGVLSRIAALTS